MGRFTGLSLAFVLWCGCNPGPVEETDVVYPAPRIPDAGAPDAAAPDAAAPDAAAPDAAAPDAGAPDAKKDDTCYQECLKSNQARAVAWEQVESDCKASCDGTAPKLELKKGK